MKIKAVADTEIPHGTLAELYSLTEFDDDSLLNLIKIKNDPSNSVSMLDLKSN